MEYILRNEKLRRKRHFALLVCQYRSAEKNSVISLSLIPRRYSSSSFNMLPVFSTRCFFSAAFHPFLYSISAFKTSGTGAYLVSMDFFSKGPSNPSDSPAVSFS